MDLNKIWFTHKLVKEISLWLITVSYYCYI